MRRSEIIDMLSSLESRPHIRKWMVAKDVVVIYDGEGFGIHEDFNMQDLGECVFYSKVKKDIVSEVQWYMNEYTEKEAPQYEFKG